MEKNLFYDQFFFFVLQITPSEIENVIESIEGVDLVSVVGIPNQQAVNLPAALIVKRKGFESLSEHDILSCVAEKLPHYKQLYGGVYFVNEMPMTLNGKIMRRSVKDIAITKFNSRSNI
jgi:acyl-coenzyme A synthetase/AMP-(fatty) acid ligase